MTNTGYESLRSHAAWIDLSARGKIRVTGEDRARLLHAMSTQDVKNLLERDAVYAFFLTAQGRILADAYIYNLGDSLLLDTEPETGPKLFAHLDKYIIADDAELHDETGEWAAIGIEGPQSLESAATFGIPVPEKPNSIAIWDNGFAARVSSSHPTGLRVFVPIDQKPELMERLSSAGIPKATAEDANIVRLENGMPRYGNDITERFLVQETEAMHAVHSNKGCYLGQEIVERVRSRAQVHRYLRALRIEGKVAPPPGTKLQANGKDAAEITSAIYSPALEEVAALAYVRTDALVNAPEFILAGAEPPLRGRLA
jgi:tRNA-modifying protein YgfZ